MQPHFIRHAAKYAGFARSDGFVPVASPMDFRAFPRSATIFTHFSEIVADCIYPNLRRALNTLGVVPIMAAASVVTKGAVALALKEPTKRAAGPTQALHKRAVSRHRVRRAVRPKQLPDGLQEICTRFSDFEPESPSGGVAIEGGGAASIGA